MRDLAGVSGVVKLARVASSTSSAGMPLGLAVDGGAYLDLDALQDLVAERTIAVE